MRFFYQFGIPGLQSSRMQVQKNFIHDPLHQAQGTLVHVRYLNLSCRNESEDMVSDVCLLVAGNFSKDQLQGLIWELLDKCQLSQGALTKIV